MIKFQTNIALYRETERMTSTWDKCIWIPCSDCTGPDYEMFPDWEVTCQGDCTVGLRCFHVPIPSHLMMFDPESTPGKSCLVLGKLCEYLQQYTKIVQYKAKHYNLLEGVYNEALLEKFLRSLDIIKTWCVKKSRESLETLLSPKLPSTVAGIVFKNLFVNWDSFEVACKFEEVDDSLLKNLENLYSHLASLYTNLRNADARGRYCDVHNLRDLYSYYYRPSDQDVKDAIDKISIFNSVMLKIMSSKSES